MNCVYVFMHVITEKVTFPIPFDMERKGCILFDIRGKVKPFINEPLFCALTLSSPVWLEVINKCLFYIK